jgi:hypothetical protein
VAAQCALAEPDDVGALLAQASGEGQAFDGIKLNGVEYVDRVRSS